MVDTKIKLYDCLTGAHLEAVKDADVRNVYLTDLTIDEAEHIERIIGCAFINNFLAFIISQKQAVTC